MVIENTLSHKIKSESNSLRRFFMFTFIETQTGDCAKQLFTKDNERFFCQIQKALLVSLYEKKLISGGEYEQCLQYLAGRECCYD